MGQQPLIPVDNIYTGVKMTMKGANRVWTEKHYFAAPGTGGFAAVPDLDAVNAAILPGGLTNARWNMLPVGCQMTQVEASQEIVYRDSRVSFVPSNYGIASNAAIGPEFQGNNSLDVRLVATSQSYAKTYLGGVPLNVVSNGVYIQGANTVFYSFLLYYMQILTNLIPVSGQVGKWGLLSLSHVDTVAPRVSINQVRYSPGPPQVLTVITNKEHKVPVNVTVGPAGYPQNAVVRLAFVPGASQARPYNQLYQVLTSDGAQTLTLDASNWPITTGVFTVLSSGYAQNMVKTFLPYARFAGPVAGTRRRGGRTGAKKGRKKVYPTSYLT
jgi:hypothetical protein